MQVDVTNKQDSSQAELKVSVPTDAFQPFIQKAAKKLSEEHSIKGFRPGKAPADVVAQTVGQERLLKEAMDEALPHFFVKAAVEHDVEAINRPNVTIEELGLDKPLRFTAVVDVLPEVTLGDPSKISVEKKDTTVGDEDLERELHYLAKMRSDYIDVARPAEEGDRVMLDFTVSVNGEPIEGGESKNHPVTLGEGQFVPDFEKGITGIKAGEERTFPMTFPDDYSKEDLRGKKADVHVKAQAVQKRSVPELNDEFAKSLGKFESMDELKNELKTNMQKEAEEKEKDRYLGELAEKLAELTTFGEIPEVLIEKEIDRRIQEFAQMLGYQQKTLDEYLSEQKKSMEDMRKDMRESAIQHVKVGLTLRTLAEQQGISVDQKEIEEEANKQLAHYQSVSQTEEEINPEDLHNHVESVLRNRKTLEKLSELVS